MFFTLNALANAQQNDGAACPSSCGNLCNNRAHVDTVLALTHARVLIVVLISTPLELVVALRGMTSQRMLQHMGLSDGNYAAGHRRDEERGRGGCACAAAAA